MKALSRIIAGTMNWGVWDKNLMPQEIGGLIELCIDHGITTFDHADIYGGYTTEADFGIGFKLSSVRRESIELISKCGIQHTVGSRTNKVKHYDYSKEYIIWSAEQSLVNLQTDHLDVLLLHRPSPLMDPDEIAEAIISLKDSGKILDFGVSNFTPLQTELIQKRIPVSYNQIEFSVSHHEPLTDGSLTHMQINEISPMAWSPLGSVFKNNDDQSVRIKLVLENLSAKYSSGTDIILLAWILRHPSGVRPVCGTASAERISNLPRALEINLEIEDWFALWEAGLGTKVP